MPRMKLQLVIIVVLAILLPHIYRYLRFMGYHRWNVTNIHPGKCTRIPGVENGAEDVELLPGGTLLITSGWSMSLEGPPGCILMVDLSQEMPAAVEVPMNADLDLNSFNPLGMAQWFNMKDGTITILVTSLNVTSMTSVVERFLFDEDENVLYHMETIGKDDPNFFFVNDLAPVSDRQFYYTNVLGKYAEWESKFLLPWSTVGFYDGKTSVILDDGMAAPNGIALSLDKQYVYVNVFVSCFMRVYERKPDNSLKQIQDYDLPMAGDNIMVDDQGDLWNTGHVNGWAVYASFDDTNILSPTQVVRLTTEKGTVKSSKTIFVDDGSLHSGGSVALPYNNKLVIGSFNRNAVICDMNNG